MQGLNSLIYAERTPLKHKRGLVTFCNKKVPYPLSFLLYLVSFLVFYFFARISQLVICNLSFKVSCPLFVFPNYNLLNSSTLKPACLINFFKMPMPSSLCKGIDKVY